MKMQSRKGSKLDKGFLAVLIILSVVLFVRFFDREVININATMLAFSYKYGFISRGLVGTVYAALNRILPFDMMNYTWTYRFTFAVTMVYYVILLAFLAFCLKQCREKQKEAARYLAVFFLLFAVPMFCSKFNFGRLDVYCVMLSLIGAILLIAERFEWLLVPIAALGVMVHQGNVFMFLNIILVLTIFKALSRKGKEQGKYLWLFLLCFLTVSALFLWFELFSHFNGANIYDDIVAKATALCNNGAYHKDVIDHEILGVDLTDREIVWRIFNVIQYPIFIVAMLPYLVIAVKFFGGLFKNAGSRQEKWKYFFVIAGAGTILPDILLKVDSGRWMFSIICYYSVVLLSLLAMKDPLIEQQMQESLAAIKRHPGVVLLLIYPFLFQPLEDVYICNVTEWIGKFLNNYLLHWCDGSRLF